MGYDPPGLESKPDDEALAGFGSLMPSADEKPGLVKRIVTLPFKILALPIKLVRAILRIPGRLFGRRRSDG